MTVLREDELNSAIARYLPDRQLITFSKEMVILPKEDGSPKGFQNITQIAYFFHEWIHYLHNISTLHGIGAFVSLAELWSAFRHTTNDSGISAGKISHASPELFQVDTLINLLATARKKPATPLPQGVAPGDIRVVSFVEHVLDKTHGAAYLNISLQLMNAHGDCTTVATELGPGEILESVAFLLERRFLERLAPEQKTEPVSVVPYHLLTILAQYIAPSLTDEEVLLCGLASLQSNFPSSDLVLILNECEAINAGKKERKAYLISRVVEQMSACESKVVALLNRIDEMFQNPEPMGWAVKETVAFMRRNFEVRKQRPFFEVELIEQMRSAGEAGFHDLMNNLMVTHGICAVRQELPGHQEEVGRDLLFDFAVIGQDAELNVGRRLMQASFDFVFRHLTPDGRGFRATNEARMGACPFYTSCADSPRTVRPEDCRQHPWRSIESSPKEVCWYAQGILKLRPGVA